ncbi:MAG: DegT/DnrJ/EryC1/StrS family aminotransferase [Pseudomonadota bacterium]
MKLIPVNTPLIEPDDRRAVLECLDSGWISSEGPQVAEFESLFARTFGRDHGIAVSNGTAGLDIAVRALNIGPGDEVLVPSLTIISCARAIVEAGARPVPVDCDPLDWNAHLSHFQERLTPRTRAIMLVHLYGLCADLEPILSWAKERGLAVIEDASQAHGLEYRGLPCGSFGDIGVFSLFANKLITTGEGGMIVCNSESLAQRCKSLRNLCFDPAKRFWHEDLGWNYRITAMQAALGIPQLRRLPALIQRKRAIGKAYRDAFHGVPHLQMAPGATPYCDNVYWVFGLTVGPDAPFSREQLMAALASDGIGTRTFFYGLHQQPVLLRRGLVDAVSLPATESLSQRGLYLPSGLGLLPDDQQQVIEAVKTFCERAG